MHITQVISHYVPAHRFGGPLRVAHGLGKALVARGHSVSVCTTNLADVDADLPVDTKGPVEIDGVTVHYAPTCGSRYWGFSPQLWRRAKVEIANADVALIHFHYQFANWAGAFWARRHGTPYALFAHGSFKRSAISRKGWWKKSLYLGLAERNNIRQADWLFFNATEERRDSRYSTRGTVLPNGVDLSEFNVTTDDTFRCRFPILRDRLVVLFLGRIDLEGKGLDKLIPAFAKFQASHPQSHLVLAGPDERGGRAATETLVRNYDLQEKVTFTGLLRGNERIAALRESDLFVLPSPSEGLSISLLEALYVGIPVLVTQGVGMSGEVAETNAGLVVSSEVPSITKGLCSLAKPDARAAMRDRATELVRQRYSWDSIAEELLGIIRTTGASARIETANGGAAAAASVSATSAKKAST